jgi:hypothetical protein
MIEVAGFADITGDPRKNQQLNEYWPRKWSVIFNRSGSFLFAASWCARGSEPHNVRCPAWIREGEGKNEHTAADSKSSPSHRPLGFVSGPTP